MSTTTSNLGLFKYDTVLDSNVPFNIDTALNANWDIIDERCGSQRNIGEIVTSTLPLIDAGLHLLDGSLLRYGIYKEFIDYIADLYAENPSANYFTTEALWQQSVTNYGVCGKFVYDRVNNTVRLPKYSNKIYTKRISSTAPVVGNGMSIGLEAGNLGHSGLAFVKSGNIGLTSRTPQWGKSAGNTSTTESYWSGGTPSTSYNYGVGITTDPTKSGIIAQLSNITTSLDGYYYIVIATSTKTDIEVNIDEIATDLNGKVDKDGSNMNASVKNFDGQWVKVNQAIASNVNFNTGGSEIKTYSLASYLPNDNYTYEVLFALGGQTADTSGASFGFSLITDIVSNVFVCRNIARSNAYVNAYGSAIVPLKTRQIKVEQVNNTSSTPTMTTLRICGYRRVGTNA